MVRVPRVLFVSSGKANLSFLLRRMYEQFGTAPAHVACAAIRPRGEVNRLLAGAMETLQLDRHGYRPMSLHECAAHHYELIVTVGADVDRSKVAQLGLSLRNPAIHLGFDRIYTQHNNRVTREFYIQVAGSFLHSIDVVDEALEAINYSTSYAGRSGVMSACTITEDGTLRRFDPDRDIATISEAGFDALEIIHSEIVPDHADVYDLVSMKRIAKTAYRRGVDLWAVSIGDLSRLATTDDTTRRLQVCHTKHALNLCEILGTRVVVLRETWPSAGDDIDTGAFGRSLDEIEPMADQVPAILAFETGPHWERLRADIESRPGAAFGVALDVGLSNITHHGAIDAFADSVGNRIAAVHVGDNDGTDDSQALPGSGEVDWDNVVGTIRRLNYRGDLIYKVRNTAPSLRLYLDKVAMAHKTYFGYFDRVTA